MSNGSAKKPESPAHRGRLQAQGPNTEESESWAQNDAPTKSEMLKRLDDLWAKLSSREKNERKDCYGAAKKCIAEAPATGIQAGPPKSFRNRKMRGGVRINLEIQSGSACVNDRDE